VPFAWTSDASYRAMSHFRVASRQIGILICRMGRWDCYSARNPQLQLVAMLFHQSTV